MIWADETTYIYDKIDTSLNKQMTYTGYKKSSVFKQLEQSILNEDLEPSLILSAELLSSEYYLDLWNFLIYMLGKHIHMGNPKLAFLMEQRFIQFRGWIHKYQSLKNHILTRELFAELISICVFSQKRSPLIIQKITEHDIEYSTLSQKLKAQDTTIFDTYFDKQKDMIELYIPLNEWFNALFNEHNPHLACYWIDWLLYYEQLCKKRKHKLIMKSREFPYVQEQYWTDYVWFLWNCILKHTTYLTLQQQKILNSLCTLFQIHFTTSLKKKRRQLLYFACMFIINPSIEQPVCSVNVSPFMTKINKIYKYIQNKQPQHSLKIKQKPNKLNYLFMNIK